MLARQRSLINRARTRQARAHKRWLAQLVPSTHEQRDVTALATGMSGLALPRESIALEVAALATPTGVRRSFLVRARSLRSRQHVCSQLQEHYPQAGVRYLRSDEDLLVCGPAEAVTCVELRLGAPGYLPLRIWQRKSLEEDGTDPLLNVLAALKSLPPRYRAVVQLVLAPAPNDWSRRAQRFAQEHPLEEERFHRQQLARVQMQNARSIEQELFLEGLGILLVLVLFGYWIWAPIQRIMPAWVLQAGSAFIQGQPQHLSAGQILQLLLGGGVLLALLVVLGVLLAGLRKRAGRNWLPKRVYDPALVRLKTERIAYRARLRLYVIGPQPGLEASVSQSDPRLHALARSYHLLSWIRRMRLLGNGAGWQAAGEGFRKGASAWGRWTAHRWQLWRRRRKAAATRMAIVARLIAAFRAYHLASGNFFVPRQSVGWIARRRLSPDASSKRVLGRLWWQPGLLTPDEVASLYHLIQAEDLRNTAFMDRGHGKTLPVPAQFTTGAGEPFALNYHKGERRFVHFPPDGLGYNLLALAGTGKGKSTLLAHLARVLYGDSTKRGCVLLDPHGDLSVTFLGCVPLARRDDVIFLNLADRLNPPGINFLDMSAGQDRDRVADAVIGTSETFWKDNWGSRIKNTMQMCVLTLCEVNISRCKRDKQNGPGRQCTMLDIIPLLQQPKYRKQLLKEVWDPAIKDWWYGYYQKQEEDDQLEIAASVITKITRFSASKVIRRIVGQPVSTISLTDVVTNGRTLIISTASGVIGDDTSTLFGSMLLGLLHTCIAEQATRPQVDRIPIYLFIDELQKFSMGVNLNAMIAELRKYGGNFALATQSLGFLDGLDLTLRHTLLANADQLFAFDMSAEDAECMAKEIGDGLTMEDILSLDNYACYTKLSHNNMRWPAFSLHLLPPPQGDPELVKTLQERSVRQYGSPARSVDKYLASHDKAIKAITDAPDAPSTQPDDDGLSPDFDSIDRDAQARAQQL